MLFLRLILPPVVGVPLQCYLGNATTRLSSIDYGSYTHMQNQFDSGTVGNNVYSKEHTSAHTQEILNTVPKIDSKLDFAPRHGKLSWSLVEYGFRRQEEAVATFVPEAVVEFGTNLWPKSPGGKYEVPLNTSGASPRLKKNLDWATRYVARGSNVLFRDAKPEDKVQTRINQTTNQCASPIGLWPNYSVLSMEFGLESCHTITIVLHELFHLLGFSHEHYRPDADNYLTYNESRRRIVAGYSTPYDLLSISHPTRQKNNATWSPRDPHLYDKTRFRRSFITSCDWHLLNTVYPGDVKPPRCVPLMIPKLLEPTPEYIKFVGNRERAEWLCQYANDHLFELGLCVTPNGEEFPDIHVEFLEGASTS